MGNYNFSDRERFEMTGLIDYSALQSLPAIWETTSQMFPDVLALLDPHAKPSVSLTYAQLYAEIQEFAAGIQALGVEFHPASLYLPITAPGG